VAINPLTDGMSRQRLGSTRKTEQDREGTKIVKLRFIAKVTQQGNSPTLWAADETDEYVIQGFELDGDTLTDLGRIPEGELVIRVPKELISNLGNDDRGADNV
jgi:hypothetical protein